MKTRLYRRFADVEKVYLGFIIYLGFLFIWFHLW